jgi:hypothetical protein
MKILDTPRINKLSNTVAFQSRYGLCLRTLVVPKRTITGARQRVWSNMAYFARAWSALLTQPQQERWIVAAGNVLSRPTLGQCGPLTGEQFFIQVNLSRACIGQPPLWEPPARAVFGANPVAAASVVSTAEGLRLLLTMSAPAAETIMVFGQAPCSTGRHKRRNVAYLGLLPLTDNGVIDITDMYVAKYGPLRPDTKIFIVTRQQKNGWEGPLKESSAVVPREQESRKSTPRNPPPEAVRGATAQSESLQATPNGALSSIPHMHTGGTGAAQVVHSGFERGSQDSSTAAEACTEPSKARSEAGGGGAEAGGK